jgi:hypothetical protein
VHVVVEMGVERAEFMLYAGLLVTLVWCGVARVKSGSFM